MIKLNFHKRIIFGVTSSGLSQIISILQTILTVPLFINAWGVDGYGKWIILTSIIMYLNLLDFGGQNYIGNLLTNDYNNNDYKNFQLKLSQGLSIFIYITIVSIIILFIISYIILNPSFTRLQNKFTVEDLTIFFIIGSAFLISIPGGVYQTIYRASGNYTRVTLIGNILKICVLLSTLFLLYLDINMLYYSLYIFSTGIIGTIVMYLDSKSFLPLLTTVHINLHNAKNGIKYLQGSFYFWLIALSNSLNIQGVILVLSLFVEPSMIVLYSTHKMIGNFTSYIGNVFQAPLWPEFTKLYEKNKKELNKLIFNSINIIMFLTIIFILFIWVFIPFLFPIWSVKKIIIDYNILTLILLQAFISSFWSTSGWVLYATNHTSRISIFSLLNGLFTILLSIILIPKYKLIGLCLSTIIGDIIFGLIIYPYLVNKVTGIKPFHLYKIIFEFTILLLPVIFTIIFTKNMLFQLCVIFLWIFLVIKYRNLIKNFKNLIID